MNICNCNALDMNSEQIGVKRQDLVLWRKIFPKTLHENDARSMTGEDGAKQPEA